MNLKSLIRKAKEEKDASSTSGSKALGGAQASTAMSQAQFMKNLPSSPSVVTEQHRVAGLSSVYIVNDWLPAAAEDSLVGVLRSQASAFIQLRGKRTARFGGNPGPPAQLEPLPDWLLELCASVGHATSSVLKQRLHEDDGPQDASGKTADTLGDHQGMPPKPNHVLVNHYQLGEGILPHTDGPAYAPWAAILSLSSAVVFEFWRDHAHTASSERPTLSVHVPPRSLLLFCQDAYCSHLHGIVDRRHDAIDSSTANAEDFMKEGQTALARGERYSLTLRYVPGSAPPEHSKADDKATSSDDGAEGIRIREIEPADAAN